MTSKEVRFTRILLEQFGIADRFDVIVGGDTVTARKPDPEPVREAIRLLGGSASEAVMIGDSENDINAGPRRRHSDVRRDFRLSHSRAIAPDSSRRDHRSVRSTERFLLLRTDID